MKWNRTTSNDVLKDFIDRNMFKVIMLIKYIKSYIYCEFGVHIYIQ